MTQVLKFDEKASLEKRHLVGKRYRDDLPPNTTSYIVASDNLEIVKYLNDKQDGMTRYILRNGKKEITKNQAVLNSVILDTKGHPGMFNLVSAFVGYNTKKDILVEASGMLNTVNLYSLFSNFALTLCFGDKPYDVHKMEKMKFEALPSTCREFQQDEAFFTVLYESGGRNRTLMVFGWDGAPMCSVIVPKSIKACSIDTEKGILYAVDGSSDELVKWHFKL